MHGNVHRETPASGRSPKHTFNLHKLMTSKKASQSISLMQTPLQLKVQESFSAYLCDLWSCSEGKGFWLSAGLRFTTCISQPEQSQPRNPLGIHGL